METWIWVIVIALAVITEVISEQLVSIWFVPGALVALILEIFNVDIWIQILVAAIVTLIGIFVLRRQLMRFVKNTDAKTNIDLIIGEKCVVTEKIHNFAGCGQVKVKGQIWSARGCSEDDEFEEGEVLTVVAIEGVKLICKRIEEE